jgi:hypothetical protein
LSCHGKDGRPILFNQEVIDISLAPFEQRVNELEGFRGYLGRTALGYVGEAVDKEREGYGGIALVSRLGEELLQDGESAPDVADCISVLFLVW